MATVNGGELVVEALKKAGIETIFGLHGAHIESIFQACMDHDVNIIDHRHEVAAGHAAEGFARHSRKIGVALVTAGGGFTNCITPLANALLDRTPMLVLTGSGHLAEDETNTLQAGIDQVAIAKPITKWAHRVMKTEHIPRLMAQAIRVATTAPRGPVLLDLPWDILTGQIEEEDAQSFEAPVSAKGGAASSEDIDAIFELLKTAKRPAILIGSEARWANVDADLGTLAANIGAPVYSDFEALGLQSKVPDDLRGGLLHTTYSFASEEAAPDVILQLGLRFGLQTLHGSGLLIPHSAKIVQIDPDGRELGRLQSITLGIQAEVGATIAQLAKRSEAEVTDRSDWIEQAADLVTQRYEGAKKLADNDLPLHPMIASEVLAKHITKDTAVIADGALTHLWFTEVIGRARPDNYLCLGYLGSMGVGFGTALGATAALKKGQTSILITGDGAVGYNFLEFDTCVRNDLPLVVVIMNNQSWGATQHFQEMTAGANRVTKTPLKNGHYHDAADAFGAKGYLVTTAEELDAALSEAIKSKRPACINVKIRLKASPPEERIMMGMDPF